MKLEGIEVDEILRLSNWKTDYQLMSTRLFHFLSDNDLTLRDCSKYTDTELKRFVGVGAVTVVELRSLLDKVGLTPKPNAHAGWRTRLVEARKKSGRLPYDVAQLVGVTTDTYRAYETKGKGPPLEILIRLLEVLEVDADWLLFGKSSMKGGHE